MMEMKVAEWFCSRPTVHRLRFLLCTAVVSDHLQWSSLLDNESLSVLSPITTKNFHYTSHARNSMMLWVESAGSLVKMDNPSTHHRSYDSTFGNFPMDIQQGRELYLMP